ncbi:MAG: LCP family protein [Firmicutes bacterium]|nr:LCP family protein [Bacillota bacterium]
MNRREKKTSYLAMLLTMLSIGVAIGMAFQVVKYGIFPLRIAGLLVGACAIIPLILLVFHILLSNFKFFRIVFSFLILCTALVYGAGNYMIYKANETLDTVTQLTNQKANKVSLIVLDSSNQGSLKEMEGKMIGVSTAVDGEGSQKELEHIDAQVEIQVKDYDNIYSMIQGLLDGEVSGIILNEVYRGDLFELNPNFNVINTNAHVLDQVTYFTKNEKKMVEPDRVSITEKPFTILVSGNDSYGTLNETSRSDVNMLLTINPKTATVLITNVSRDAYVPIACGADADDSCGQGQMDKLTHTGLDGVATTEKTIEEFVGVPINYNVRINFSSFENIVDAVGGIDVYVEEGCAVEAFYVNGTEGVKEGWNHLNGARALGFVRERKAYMDGANQRVRNQQEAIRALITKVCSFATFKNFNQIISALNSAFETNMSAKEIKQFISFQFTQFPEWKIEGYSMRYEPNTGFCYYLQGEAYVDVPYLDSVDIARQKIEAVIQGKSSETIEDPNAEGVAGSYSPEQQWEIIHEGELENAQMAGEPIVEEPVYEEPIYEEYYEEVYYY